MRDTFKNFNNLLPFFGFIGILVCYCVIKNLLTYLYSTDDGIAFQKAYANFYFLNKSSYLLP